MQRYYRAQAARKTGKTVTAVTRHRELAKAEFSPLLHGTGNTRNWQNFHRCYTAKTTRETGRTFTAVTRDRQHAKQAELSPLLHGTGST